MEFLRLRRFHPRTNKTKKTINFRSDLIFWDLSVDTKNKTCFAFILWKSKKRPTSFYYLLEYFIEFWWHSFLIVWTVFFAAQKNERKKNWFNKRFPSLFGLCVIFWWNEFLKHETAMILIKKSKQNVSKDAQKKLKILSI